MRLVLRLPDPPSVVAEVAVALEVIGIETPVDASKIKKSFRFEKS